ncbi:nucleoporin NUP35-like [Mixophyes fleayi]|uniref:nucleoporin NUP35-like n=1 Tax=Mixophyes fleayi TaxID=3061075 RepID=UPI003F4DE98C
MLWQFKSREVKGKCRIDMADYFFEPLGGETMALGSSPKTSASIYDDSPSTSLDSTPNSLSGMQNSMTSTPCTSTGVCSPSKSGRKRKNTISPVQLDASYSPGDDLTFEDQLDDTWVTVFGFSRDTASYILLQFAEYGNVIKHVMSENGNWMHIQFQTKLQAKKALRKDGWIFANCISIGVRPCIDESVMASSEISYISSCSAEYTPPAKIRCTCIQQLDPERTELKPFVEAYKAASSVYQVLSDRIIPQKKESFLSKALDFIFRW